MEKPDALNIKQWSGNRRIEMLADIKDYITMGMDKESAIKTVFDESCVGSGIKAQIRYELKDWE